MLEFGRGAGREEDGMFHRWKRSIRVDASVVVEMCRGGRVSGVVACIREAEYQGRGVSGQRRVGVGRRSIGEVVECRAIRRGWLGIEDEELQG
jgi:hypothetical protein